MDLRIDYHFITVLLVVLFSIKLYAQRKTRDVELRHFWLTVFCCALLVFQDILESYTSTDPSMRFWRILLSALGYILRPTAALGLLLGICPPRKRNWMLWVPWGINAAVNLTAFFSPLAFSFNENYKFVRGPLGYVVFIVSFIYMLQILYYLRTRFYEGKKAERWIMFLCMIGCLAASVVDAFYGGTHINEAIMISSIFLYIYLRSHDIFLDPLTSLRNRIAFYNDTEQRKNEITAVAAIDMNGLKELNDAKGHAEGDRALMAIGTCLMKNSDRSIVPYRVGGDEFTVLFSHQSEEEVKQYLARAAKDIEASGFSVAAGHAMKTGDKSLDNALHEADRIMYGNKAAYYQQKGKDRRSSARN